MLSTKKYVKMKVQCMCSGSAFASTFTFPFARKLVIDNVQKIAASLGFDGIELQVQKSCGI